MKLTRAKAATGRKHARKGSLAEAAERIGRFCGWNPRVGWTPATLGRKIFGKFLFGSGRRWFAGRDKSRGRTEGFHRNGCSFCREKCEMRGRCSGCRKIAYADRVSVACISGCGDCGEISGGGRVAPGRSSVAQLRAQGQTRLVRCGQNHTPPKDKKSPATAITEITEREGTRI